MKKINTATLVVTLLMVIALNFGCGKSNRDPNFDWNTGFGVQYINIDPSTGKIIPKQPLDITFNKPVQPGSVSQTNVLVEYYATYGDMSQKKPLLSQYNLKDGNVTISISPIGNWPLDSTIMITFERSFQSIDGESLSGQTTWWASTGSSNVLGAISVPGKPVVLSLVATNYTPWNDNLAFIAEFNEDLNVPPTASAKLKTFNEWTDAFIPLISWPVFPSSNRFFYLLFSDCGCAADLFFPGRNIIINVFGGRDTEYDTMNPYEGKFDWLDDYFGSGCAANFACTGS